MLVLSRKVGERIVIDECIEIQVCAVGRNTVKIGIAAPREVSIRREELSRIDLPAPDTSYDPRVADSFIGAGL